MTSIQEIEIKLKDSLEYGNTASVFYFALNHMKNNPSISVIEALNYANYMVFEKIYKVDA